MTAVGQTALVVRVPEAEPLVGPFRLAHDPVAARGMPAHVTAIAARLARASQNQLPVRVVVTDVWLMEARDGVWQPREPFALGSSKGVPGPSDDRKVP